MKSHEAKCIFNNLTLQNYDANDIIDIILSKSLPERSYIVTPNIDHFFRLDTEIDNRFNQAYRSADIVVCDSRIARILSRLESHPIRKICPGSDLTERLLSSKKIKEQSVLVVGSQPALIESLAIKYGIPNLNCYSPPMGFINNPEEFNKCIDTLLSCDADIAFLALGSPQQEILASAVKSSRASGVKFNGVMLCVGASLDFLTGVSTRAPIVMQKLNLEWLHRVLSNPSRLAPRYWKNFRWIISYITKKIYYKIS